MERTNLERVKCIATTFLNIDITETPFSPGFVQHPIFESGYIGMNQDGELKIVNILEDEKSRAEIIEQYHEKIDRCSNTVSVYNIIRKSYRLTFLKFIWNYLSVQDKGRLLRSAWTESEDPNQDVNVSISEAVKMFKNSDKEFLMKENELEFLRSLPDEIKLYRGVAVGRNPEGLSWTPNLELARWFSHRFDNKEEKGYVKCGIANKKDILAYLDERNEEEIVISCSAVKNIQIVEK